MFPKFPSLKRHIVIGVGLVALTLPRPGSASDDSNLLPNGEKLSSLALKSRVVPKPSDLDTYVENHEAALILGKALFWDSQVSSDGVMACASCHFHAGADSRSRNQIGLPRGGPRGFAIGGPNYQLTAADFPFFVRSNPSDPTSPVLRDIHNVVSSSGAFKLNFNGLTQDSGILVERVSVVPDSEFQVSAVNTRRVLSRNVPSVINAVFNLRNFWDGRAQDVFNGVSSSGLRDTGAFVYRAASADSIEAVRVSIFNSSLASQAVVPALNSSELSATGRTFPELARRLLTRRPLASQLVDEDDSVLGERSLAPRAGLDYDSYAQLVRRAFNKRWWQGRGSVVIGGVSYTQMEANFTLFWGLALQIYQSTLVSDEAPIDFYARGDDDALTSKQKQGLALFFSKGCAECHSGPEFTSASVAESKKFRLDYMITKGGATAVHDKGYYRTGVRPITNDFGVTQGTGPGGTSWSESQLLKDVGPLTYTALTGAPANTVLSVNDLIVPQGSFKVPGLRNVGLTAPYFHNGGQLTLRQVIDFYDRGGDFPLSTDDVAIRPLGLSEIEKDALVAFLLSLTDERVRLQRAPFDHPQLKIPNGHTGGTMNVTEGGLGVAQDEFIILDAVGSKGTKASRNFLQ